jgi:hypothetical protein
MLPLELWIVIFDMVIEEGIVRLDQCDHTTFPYDHLFISYTEDPHQFYGSYHRLRLVCRTFNVLLGTRPQCDLDASSFPFPMSVRALHLGGCNEPVFRQLLEDASRCERLVFLRISCGLNTVFSRPNLLDLFNAGEGGAFRNVQRLTLWILDMDQEISFWTRLQRGFAQLVTLTVEARHGWLRLEGEGDKVATFERLEILFLGGSITCSGCHFPLLRHASVGSLLGISALEVFRRSSHLETLLIRIYCAKFSMDLRSFSRLRVLSLPERQLQEVVPLDCGHPLEHLWIRLGNISKNPTLIDEIVKRIPRIVRITVDIRFMMEERRTQRIQEFKRMRLDPFGLALKPITLDSPLLVIE